MAPTDEFPADSDLDLMLLVDRPTASKDPIDELYRGVAIEAGLRGVDDYATAEKVLANPEVADHIASGGIIADPMGLLGGLQPAVARELSRRRWVAARCEDEKARYQAEYAAARAAQSHVECMLHAFFAVHNAASLVSVALLTPPTHRRSMVQLREQVAAIGRPELAENALDALGMREMTSERVRAYAVMVAGAFDRALEVKRTPAPFDFKLRPHLRPYLIDWAQGMIEQGKHREAMPWIASGMFLCVGVLLNDAHQDEKPRYAAELGGMLEELGFGTDAARAERLQLTAELGDSLYGLADRIVAGRPDELVPA